MKYRIINHNRPLPYPTYEIETVPNKIAWYCFTCKLHTSHVVTTVTASGDLDSAVCTECGNGRDFTHTTIATETLKESASGNHSQGHYEGGVYKA